MGIQGLLPFLKSIHRQSHLENWSGQTLAVDGYVWLHRGAYSCAQELCQGTPTTKHVDYFIQRINQLTRCGITPYVVFDGDHLPNKKLTESDRASKREAALARANRFLSAGQRDKAREEFVKAADVTPKMAHEVIRALKSLGIKYVVAPFEADAQLRYLEITGQVTGIITEDSDLLVYGAKNVLFKLDHNGSCIHICRDHFGLVKEARMSLWTDREFRQMAILSGCDYLSSIPGLGIKRAYDLIRRFNSAERAIKATRLEGKLSVPLRYEKLFQQAELTFLHQLVYDPSTRSLVPLHPLPDPPPPSESLLGCGERWEEEIAVGVAEGRLDPLTKQEFQSSNISNTKNSTTEQPKGFAFISQPRNSKPKNQKSIPDNQPTLKNFILKSTPTSTTSKRRPDPAKEPLNELEKNCCSKPQREPELPSKFFEAEEKPSPIKEDSTAVVLDGLAPEDIPALSQQSWDAMTEISGVDRVEGGDDQNHLLGEDLPTSQMQCQSDVQVCDAALNPPGSSFQTNSCTDDTPNFTRDSLSPTQPFSSSPIPTITAPKVESGSKQIASDDPISSDSEICSPQPLSRPRVTLITPSCSLPSPNISSKTARGPPKRRATEPISRVAHEEIMSSDPILGSDDYQIQSTSVPRPNDSTMVQRPSKRVRQGFLETSTPRNPACRGRGGEGDDEPMTPSLARIASGIRNKFTYKPKSNNLKDRLMKTNPRSIIDDHQRSEKAISDLIQDDENEGFMKLLLSKTDRGRDEGRFKDREGSIRKSHQSSSSSNLNGNESKGEDDDGGAEEDGLRVGGGSKITPRQQIKSAVDKVKNDRSDVSTFESDGNYSNDKQSLKSCSSSKLSGFLFRGNVS